ncbi:hypothetical protein G7092_24580 [Mucilaginibacter sp. HC2]|uniref:hypothetical protein n=1 Tax=Mucilaginibacter inviolabilis TaxID=2714892 RepID=UPI001409652F|nr:hypothetical protein [Mucilaginibacter inviolabilis]NHA06999.1 hypothetical protein [Mucilaginibacter inviolabilis]
MGRDEVGIALSKNLPVGALNSAYDVYKKYLNDLRLISLFNKYSIDVNDLTDEVFYKGYGTRS